MVFYLEMYGLKSPPYVGAFEIIALAYGMGNRPEEDWIDWE